MDAFINEEETKVRVETSRGTIIVTDTHMFDIAISDNFAKPEQITVTIGGKSFRIKSLLDASNEVGYDGGRTAC